MKITCNALPDPTGLFGREDRLMPKRREKIYIMYNNNYITTRFLEKKCMHAEGGRGERV